MVPKAPKKYLGHFDTDFAAVFSSNSNPRRRKRKNMYTVCQKKTSREATICRREAPTTRRRCLLLAPKAPGAGKKTQSRSDYCRREAPTTRRRRLLLAPKAPGAGGSVGAEGAEGALHIVGQGSP